MELLVTLRKPESMKQILSYADGIVTGSRFTTGYHLEPEQIVEAVKYSHSLGKKAYIVMDNFISEDEKMLMYDYLEFIDSLEVDGLYFHDLGIYSAARSSHLFSKLIYDGKTVMCNSLDAGFLLDKGIDSIMISRELTLEEIKQILERHSGRIDMQIFGHLRLSYSRRRFLFNYFRQIDREYDYIGKESLSLIEEQREYRMPIVEDANGTYIYTDYIFEMFNEISDLRQHIRRGVVDTLFIEDESLICQLLRDYRRINAENREFIRDSFLYNYPGSYSSGYLYQKTNIAKNE